WSEHTVPLEHRAVLDGICGKVTYLGHSSAPVQMWVDDNPANPNLLPADIQAAQRLRVFGPGRYDTLLSRYRAGLRPVPAVWQGYGPPAFGSRHPEAHGSFDENLIVLRQTSGQRYALESGLALGSALRNTLMSRAGKTPAPEWLGGHQPNGEPSRQDHLAI